MAREDIRFSAETPAGGPARAAMEPISYVDKCDGLAGLAT
jgi:hypothetical protein